MILPTKHIKTERALLGVGAELLGFIKKEVTVSQVWDSFRLSRNQCIAPITYDWFILALDFLFAINAVSYEKGLLMRVNQ